jgi:hypothetical protein
MSKIKDSNRYTYKIISSKGVVERPLHLHFYYKFTTKYPKASKKYLFFTKTSKKYAKTLDKLSQKCYTSFVSELESLQALVLQAFESSYKKLKGEQNEETRIFSKSS